MAESTEEPFKENALSENILLLLQQTKLQNASEALTVLLHGFMMEIGYISPDVDESEKDRRMPENWMKNGFYKMRYFYQGLPHLYCWMTCVPLYNNLSIYGEIDSPGCEENIQLSLNMDIYIKDSEEFSNPSTYFLNLKDLSIYFKDGFSTPLSKLLHETLGIYKPFGFDGLLNDLKLTILELLPVESLVACSGVNKKFHELANSPYLWKSLYLKDFSKDGIPDIPSTSESGNDWKKAYKRQYLSRKKVSYHRCPDFFSFPNPTPHPFAPNLQVDPRTDFDFTLYDAFPHLRPLQPAHLFPGFPGNGNLFRRFW